MKTRRNRQRPVVARASHASRRLGLEPLEDRRLLAVTVSINDVTVTEGEDSIRFPDEFVSSGSGGLARPGDSVFGPDVTGDGQQELYVVSMDTSQVLQYDGITGDFIDEFLSTSGTGKPRTLAFGPDGNIYVIVVETGNNVLRFDGTTGLFIDEFVPSGSGGLDNPDGIAFTSDGDLLITSHGTNSILRYEGQTGAFVDEFVPAGSGGLDLPRRISYGPDSNGDGSDELYVVSNGTNEVLRYNGVTGDFLDVYATNDPSFKPMSLAFAGNGTFYLTAQERSPCCNNIIQRHDGQTGEILETFDAAGGWSFAIGPDDNIYNSGNAHGNFVLRLAVDQSVAFTVALDRPSADRVTVDYATSNGSAIDGSDFTSASGTLVFEPGVTTRAIIVPTLDDDAAESPETFTVELSNASPGVTIADDQGIGTILDDDVLLPPTADFNGDGVVDGGDFVAWQIGFGDFPHGGATRADGDADGDGSVDGDDFLIWQQQFGSSSGGGASTSPMQQMAADDALAADSFGDLHSRRARGGRAPWQSSLRFNELGGSLARMSALQHRLLGDDVLEQVAIEYAAKIKE